MACFFFFFGGGTLFRTRHHGFLWKMAEPLKGNDLEGPILDFHDCGRKCTLFLSPKRKGGGSRRIYRNSPQKVGLLE